MSDVLDGGAPAPAEATAAPVATEAPVSPPNPVHSEPVAEPAAPEVKKAPSIDDALDRATKKVESEAKAEKAPEPVKTETAKRDDTGKFAAKEPAATTEKPLEAKDASAAPEATAKPVTSRSEAPSRFSPDAKAAWDTAPEPIKAEVHRALRELEQGHQKYKADAEVFDTIREFHDAATKNGSNLKTALTKVVDIENAFAQNPIAGCQKIADHFGISLRAVAEHIVGQSPDQQATQTDSTIQALKAELASLRDQVGGVTKTFEDQRTTAVLGKVETFAKDHPRFDELSDDITFFLKSGRTSDLAEAYSLAERLNPAPASPDPVASSARLPDIEAQTLKGSKSVTGAPSAGSNPSARKPSKSLDESLDRAFAGLG